MVTTYILITASLVAINCALLGCYLVLRKMAMVSDAISHAVLPGIVLAFLLTGSREGLPMLIGAGILGVLTTVIIEFLHQKGKLQTDASIGITFTFLFAIGIILLSRFAGKVDLDQDCVLYGEIAYVPLNLWVTESGINLGPRAIWMLGGVFLIIISFVVFAFKELLATTFDPGYSVAIGISATLWHYVLMSLVSFTTVASFESVGAILVVAFLIVPPAAAYLLTDNFRKMLLLSCAIGVASAFSGYYIAGVTDGSIAASMAVMTGIFFGMAFAYSKFKVQSLKFKI
ncbi:MAG: metal ABC transporter permease [Cytophagaceae bacterium]